MEPPTVPHVNLPPRRHRPQQQTRGVDVSASASSGSMSQPSHTGTHRLAPYSTVGQFSLAPTTQTTVVTTTTTTTTSFPQLLMRPPRNLNELDPKEFPLAAVPTPSNLKRFCFDLNGKPTHFRETDDPEQSLRELDMLVHDLDQNNGLIRKVIRGEEHVQAHNPLTSPPASATLPSASHSASSRKRPASPVSISEAAERVSLLQKGTKRRQTGRPRSGILSSKANTPSPRKYLRSSRNATPATPVEINPPTTHAPRPVRLVHQQLSQLQNSQSLFTTVNLTPNQNHQQETPLTLSPQMGVKPLDLEAEDLEMGSTPTPQEDLELDDAESDSTIIPTTLSPDAQHVANDNVAVGSTQPLSLPSPSLSPVTAALTHGGSYFSAMDTDEISSPLELPPSEEDVIDESNQLTLSPQRHIMQLQTPREQYTPGLMEIPKMLDSFDAMPSAVKTYVMYQLLRRCSKSTLQTVAEVVNPALKCDFLTLLPPELSLNIIKYLDIKSLCNAAQVSKRWRIIIDSDEWTWKKLFDNDGYVLGDGELDRAIREGWGFQDPQGDDDCERDVNAGTRSNCCAPTLTTPPPHGRQKKKFNTRANSKKQQKKREAVETLGKEEFNEVISEIYSNSVGPVAAANAAEKAGSKASVGLQSLRNLHLFKSIYRRHHIIRRSWIRPQVKPRHISFRGHQRHVVTCLQFDTDKILTGSDDTNINVYDTNTGALRNKLEGHEGGVWALQYEGNTLVSGSTDRTVRIWNIPAGECTQIFHGHTSTVRCLQILMPTKIGVKPDGKDLIMPKVPLIITGSRDSTLRVWKLPMRGDRPYLPGSNRDANDNDLFLNPNNNPYFIRTLSGHQHSVRAISAHGDTLVSGSYDYSVKVWKISTGETVHTLRGHVQKVYSVVLDHKRNRCISGSMDNLVKVWSLETGSVIYTLEGHTQLVGLLDLSHDRLVSAAADSTLRIWDPETGNCKHTLSAHTGAITCFQHDGHKVISGSDRTLKMWNVQTGEFIRDLLTDLSGVWQVKFNERICVAAVQRDQVTYIEVLDFGAARDGVPEDERGRRIVVDRSGLVIPDGNDTMDEAGDDF
ncbi:hypothetical protein B9Z19DRAFT_1128134 [Tuber borchii]|uniref:F-box domain-containing protein n=1 Tax=Tuber borchii TaxID=42251 RepID=A0A2T6ZQ26_TUBBO|nr:hypothetical protein B9Z19DRAFT_1128134 [Tuber borchii]